MICAYFNFIEIEIIKSWLRQIPIQAKMLYMIRGVDAFIQKIHEVTAQREHLFMWGDINLYKQKVFERTTRLRRAGANFIFYDFILNTDSEELRKNLSWIPLPDYQDLYNAKNEGILITPQNYYDKRRILQRALLKQWILSCQATLRVRAAKYHDPNFKKYFKTFYKQNDGHDQGDKFIKASQMVYKKTLDALKVLDEDLTYKLSLLLPMMEVKYLIRNFHTSLDSVDIDYFARPSRSILTIGYDLASTVDEFLKKHPDVKTNPLESFLEENPD